MKNLEKNNSIHFLRINGSFSIRFDQMKEKMRPMMMASKRTFSVPKRFGIFNSKSGVNGKDVGNCPGYRVLLIFGNTNYSIP